MNGQQPTPAALKSSPADDPAQASRPPSVPDYELLRRIGSGSYGEVWLARNVLGRWRAVKIIYRSRFQDPRPFEREFEGIQRFEPISRSHPSQLAILHVGKNDDAGCFYYVMELADPVISNQCSVSNKQSSEVTEASGMVPQPKPAPLTTAPLITDPLITDYSPHTLRYDIEQRRRLAIPDCVQIGLSLATALAHLHQHGLVHRDIKPSNVIFVNGVPKLGDIGLVTEAGDTQSIVGTEGYIPPEGPGTPQADLYSLGKVLYEISTGLDRRRFAELPEDLRTWPDRGAVAEFNEIVLKACTKNLARRYPSAQELRADLAVLQRGQSVKRKRTIQRRLAAITRFSLVAGPIALIAVGGGYLRQAVNQNQPAGVGGAIQPEMKGTKNREAWNAYLSGLHYYKRDTQDGSRRAIEYLKEAIRLDPKFAQPYAELAEIYRWSDYLFPSGHEAMTKGKEAALQALALDDSLAQAHKELGYVAAHLDRDFSKATKELKRAIELSPYYATAHAMYAWLLLEMGRLDEAKRAMKLALKLDPVFARTRCSASCIFLAAGESNEALGQLRRALDLDPNSWWAFEQLGEIYEEAGKFPEAIEMFRKAAIADGAESEKVARQRADLQRAFSTGGARGYWQKKLEFANGRSNIGGELYDLAIIYLHLGKTDSAFECLNKIEAQSSDYAFRINFDRRFDPVRSEPRFRDLLRKLGLER